LFFIFKLLETHSGNYFWWKYDLGGCCCEIDESCEEMSECREEFHKEHEFRDKPCAWPNHFARWLQKKFPHLEIIPVNSAAPASRSEFILERLFVRFNPNSPQKLGSNDLIIIDYSVNDSSDAPQAGANLELAVRKILTAYESTPKLLLIETYGYGFYSDLRHVPIGQSSHSPDYSILHRAVAKHYSLPYWSSINAVWSSLNRNSTNLPSFLAFTESHPPWHVHLFIADIIAATFLAEYHHWCSSNSPTKSIVPTTIPPPLYGAQAPLECQLSEFVINVNAAEEYKKLIKRKMTQSSPSLSNSMTPHSHRQIRRRTQ
jgi:hypothetical protein